MAFDKDGTMYSSTAFGDYPNWAEPMDIKNPEDRFTGMDAFVLRKPVEVSSTDSIHVASNLTDESMRTYWAARSGNPGEWARIGPGQYKEYTCRAIKLLRP